MLVASSAPTESARLKDKRSNGVTIAEPDFDDEEFEKCLWTLFSTIDSNSSGSINKRELIKTVRTHPEIAAFFQLPKEIHQEDGTRERVERWFQHIDENDDREITWEEIKDHASEFQEAWQALRDTGELGATMNSLAGADSRSANLRKHERQDVEQPQANSPPARTFTTKVSSPALTWDLPNEQGSSRTRSKSPPESRQSSNQDLPNMNPKSRETETQSEFKKTLSAQDIKENTKISRKSIKIMQKDALTELKKPFENVSWIQSIARHVATTSVPVLHNIEPHPVFVNMANSVTGSFQENDDRNHMRGSPGSDMRYYHMSPGVDSMTGSMMSRSPRFSEDLSTTMGSPGSTDPAPEPDSPDLDISRTLAHAVSLENVESAEAIMERMRNNALMKGNAASETPQMSPQNVNKWWERTKEKEKQRRAHIESLKEKYLKKEKEECPHKPFIGKQDGTVKSAFLLYEEKQKKELLKQKKELEDKKKSADQIRSDSRLRPMRIHIGKEGGWNTQPPIGPHTVLSDAIDATLERGERNSGDVKCTFQPQMDKKKKDNSNIGSEEKVHDRLFNKAKIQKQNLEKKRAEEEKKLIEDLEKMRATTAKPKKKEEIIVVEEEPDSPISEDEEPEIATPIAMRTQNALKARDFLLKSDIPEEEEEGDEEFDEVYKETKSMKMNRMSLHPNMMLHRNKAVESSEAVRRSLELAEDTGEGPGESSQSSKCVSSMVKKGLTKQLAKSHSVNFDEASLKSSAETSKKLSLTLNGHGTTDDTQSGNVPHWVEDKVKKWAHQQTVEYERNFADVYKHLLFPSHAAFGPGAWQSRSGVQPARQKGPSSPRKGQQSDLKKVMEVLHERIEDKLEYGGPDTTWLMLGAAKWDFKAVKEALKAFDDMTKEEAAVKMEQRDCKGKTALHHAAMGLAAQETEEERKEREKKEHANPPEKKKKKKVKQEAETGEAEEHDDELDEKNESLPPWEQDPLKKRAYQTIRKFKKEGANLEARDERGCTPLILAAANGKLDAVAALLKYGALITARDVTGATAYDYAKEFGHTETRQLLERKGEYLDQAHREKVADRRAKKFASVQREEFAIATAIDNELKEVLKQKGAGTEGKVVTYHPDGTVDVRFRKLADSGDKQTLETPYGQFWKLDPAGEELRAEWKDSKFKTPLDKNWVKVTVQRNQVRFDSDTATATATAIDMDLKKRLEKKGIIEAGKVVKYHSDGKVDIQWAKDAPVETVQKNQVQIARGIKGRVLGRGRTFFHKIPVVAVARGHQETELQKKGYQTKGEIVEYVGENPIKVKVKWPKEGEEGGLSLTEILPVESSTLEVVAEEDDVSDASDSEDDMDDDDDSPEGVVSMATRQRELEMLTEAEKQSMAKKHKKLAQEIEDALANEDFKEVQKKLKQARKLNFPEEEVAKVKEHIQKVEEHKVYENKVADALANADIYTLERLIKEGGERNMPEHLIARAKVFYDDAMPRHLAREALLKAVETNDIQKLSVAIEEAVRTKIPEVEITQARENLSVLKNRQEARDTIERITNEAKTVDMSNIENLTKMKKMRHQLTEAYHAGKKYNIPESDLRKGDKCRRMIHNFIEDLKGTIRVFCRIRPLSKTESERGDKQCVKFHEVTGGVEIDHEHSARCGCPKGNIYKFDSLFTPGTQEEVFEDCCDLVTSVFDGFNITIFAYGQTGAGKTFTLNGVKGKEGVAPRTMKQVFAKIEEKPEREFDVNFSMVEIYRQDILDLLRDEDLAREDTESLNVKLDKENKVVIEGVIERSCKDFEEINKAYAYGMNMRTVAATAMNSESSRSHLLLIMRVKSTHKTNRQDVISAKILICDLAGSERLKKSQVTGDMQKEAIEINKSLTALGDVISALTVAAPGAKNSQIPYRNHKLTQCMQDSLGGSAKTLMFMNCSPSLFNIDETIMSLKWATRAKKVTNTIVKQK